MNTWRLLAYLCIVIQSSACTVQRTMEFRDSSFQFLKFKEEHVVNRTADWSLHSSTSLFICGPEIFNSLQRDHILPSTKLKMHSAFISAFSRAFVDVQSSEATWELNEALKLAREADSQILLVPSLQLLIDDLKTLNAYESGQESTSDAIYALDTAVIRVAIYDVFSGNLIDVVSLNSRGKLFKQRNYSIARFIGRAAMVLSDELSGRQLAPFG